jgi:hypothetical protein
VAAPLPLPLLSEAKKSLRAPPPLLLLPPGLLVVALLLVLLLGLASFLCSLCSFLSL